MGRACDKGKKPMQRDSYEGKDTKDTCVLSCGIPKKKNGTKKVEEGTISDWAELRKRTIEDHQNQRVDVP